MKLKNKNVRSFRITNYDTDHFILGLFIAVNIFAFIFSIILSLILITIKSILSVLEVEPFSYNFHNVILMNLDTIQIISGATLITYIVSIIWGVVYFFKHKNDRVI
jgi:hypothetical protein